MKFRVLVLTLVVSAALEAAPVKQRVGAALRSAGQHVVTAGNFAQRAGSAALLMALLASPLAAENVGLQEELVGWHAFDSEPVGGTAELPSVFYVLAKGATHAEQPFREVVYVGDFQAGNAVFMGDHLRSFLSNNAATEFALYDNDGLVLDNVSFQQIAKFPVLDGFREAGVYAVDGLQLADEYTPLRIRKFPTNVVGKELLVVSYQHRWGRIFHDHEDLPAVWRSCEVKRGGWPEADIGVSDCSPSSVLHAPVFLAETLQLVGFSGGHGFELVPVGGVDNNMIVFLNLFGLMDTAVAEEETIERSVTPHKMLATTWGKIKSGR